MTGQNLFDFDEPESDEPESDEPESDEPESTWQEVPQERFLSWSAKEQALYCAARDEDSATIADSEEEELWFLERAQAYRNTSR